MGQPTAGYKANKGNWVGGARKTFNPRWPKDEAGRSSTQGQTNGDTASKSGPANAAQGGSSKRVPFADRPGGLAGEAFRKGKSVVNAIGRGVSKLNSGVEKLAPALLGNTVGGVVNKAAKVGGIPMALLSATELGKGDFTKEELSKLERNAGVGKPANVGSSPSYGVLAPTPTPKETTLPEHLTDIGVQSITTGKDGSTKYDLGEHGSAIVGPARRKPVSAAEAHRTKMQARMGNPVYGSSTPASMPEVSNKVAERSDPARDAYKAELAQRQSQIPNKEVAPGKAGTVINGQTVSNEYARHIRNQQAQPTLIYGPTTYSQSYSHGLVGKSGKPGVSDGYKPTDPSKGSTLYGGPVVKGDKLFGGSPRSSASGRGPAASNGGNPNSIADQALATMNNPQSSIGDIQVAQAVLNGATSLERVRNANSKDPIGEQLKLARINDLQNKDARILEGKADATDAESRKAFRNSVGTSLAEHRKRLSAINSKVELSDEERQSKLAAMNTEFGQGLANVFGVGSEHGPAILNLLSSGANTAQVKSYLAKQSKES